MTRKFEAWIWSAALLTVLLPAIAHAAIFKWTDENGKVHYSDKPPAEEAEQLDVDTGDAGTGSSLTDTQRKLKQQKLLDAFEKEREDKKAADGKAKEEKKQRMAWCQRAKEELARYRSASHLYDYDDDGNKVVYSRAPRESVLRDYQKQIEYNC